MKWVDASGMAVRMHAEKAVSAEEEQQWQVLMESVGRESGRFERTSAWKGQETLENVDKCRFSAGHRRNEREEGHGRTRMKEEKRM